MLFSFLYALQSYVLLTFSCALQNQQTTQWHPQKSHNVIKRLQQKLEILCESKNLATNVTVTGTNV